MAVSSNSGRASARPPGFGRFPSDAATVWAYVVPCLPTRAGFWAMMVGRPLILARMHLDGPSRSRSAAT